MDNKIFLNGGLISNKVKLRSFPDNFYSWAEMTKLHNFLTNWPITKYKYVYFPTHVSTNCPIAERRGQAVEISLCRTSSS